MRMPALESGEGEINQEAEVSNGRDFSNGAIKTGAALGGEGGR